MGGKKTDPAVIQSYIDQFDFKGVALDIDMRAFLNLFRLPMEGKEWERIITPFGLTYSKRHPTHFEKKDAEVLAFYVMTLNSIKHNKNVLKGMDLTKEEFVDILTREGYSSFPKKELADIFDRICTDEIKTDTLKSE